MKINSGKKIYVSSSLIMSILFTLLMSIILLFEYQGEAIEQYKYYGVIALLGYMWIFFITPKKVNGKINLYLLYMAVTIPFYFGEHILILLGYGEKLADSFYSILDGRIEMKYNVQAMKYVIIALQCVNVGYHLIRTKKVVTNKNDKNKDRWVSAVKQIANLIFIVTVIPTMARLIYDVINANAYGHLAAYNARRDEQYMGIWFICSYLKGWFMPACYMKIITGDKLGKKVAYIALAMYCILYLLSGSRYEVIQIAFVIFIIDIYGKKRNINKKKIVKYVIFAYVAFAILRSMAYTRDVTGSGLSLESIISVLGGDVIYEVLYETGGTFTSIGNLFKYCPSYLPFNNGKSVLGSVLYVMPSFIRPDMMNDIVLHISAELSPFYFGFTEAGYGSTFLTEAYFNFGYFSFIEMIIIGMLLKKLTDSIACFSETKNKIGLIISVYIMSELLWAIRSDMYLIPRHVVYYILLPILVAKFIVKKRR